MMEINLDSLQVYTNNLIDCGANYPQVVYQNYERIYFGVK